MLVSHAWNELKSESARQGLVALAYERPFGPHTRLVQARAASSQPPRSLEQPARAHVCAWALPAPHQHPPRPPARPPSWCSSAPLAG